MHHFIGNLNNQAGGNFSLLEKRKQLIVKAKSFSKSTHASGSNDFISMRLFCIIEFYLEIIWSKQFYVSYYWYFDILIQNLQQ